MSWVAKFGGTSVGSEESLKHCLHIIKNQESNGIVVCSATSGTTNQLLQLFETASLSLIEKIYFRHESLALNLGVLKAYQDDLEEITLYLSALNAGARSDALKDAMVACGELLSTKLMTVYLEHNGIKSEWFDVRSIMRTDDHFTKAEVDLDFLKAAAHDIVVPKIKQTTIVTQGFIGQTPSGLTTTLGRGGSDYSAGLLAEAIEDASLYIWTDVPGILSTDPRLIKQAHIIDHLSFSEASELSNFGAKVLHPKTLAPAMRSNTKVFIGKTSEPKKGGTWVFNHPQKSPQVKALAKREGQILITLHSLNMLNNFGFLTKVFSVIEKAKISVDLVTTSEVSIAITLDAHSMSEREHRSLKDVVLPELSTFCHVKEERNLTLIAMVGNQLSQVRGMLSQTLGLIEDDIRLICQGASPHNLCFLVDEKMANGLLGKLHHRLFEFNRPYPEGVNI